MPDGHGYVRQLVCMVNGWSLYRVGERIRGRVEWFDFEADEAESDGMTISGFESVEAAVEELLAMDAEDGE